MNYTQIRIRTEYKDKLQALAERDHRSMMRQLEAMIDHKPYAAGLHDGRQVMILELSLWLEKWIYEYMDGLTIAHSDEGDVHTQNRAMFSKTLAKTLGKRLDSLKADPAFKTNPVYNVAGNSEMLGEE